MERGFENREQQLSDFKLKVNKAYKLLEDIRKLNSDLWPVLYNELFFDPVNKWKVDYKDLTDKSQFVHALIYSGESWDACPNLDLPGDLVAKHLTEVVMPRLEEELEKLRR